MKYIYILKIKIFQKIKIFGDWDRLLIESCFLYDITQE